MRDESGRLQAQVYTSISWRETLAAVEQLVETGKASDFCKRDEERLQEAAIALRNLRLEKLVKG